MRGKGAGERVDAKPGFPDKDQASGSKPRSEKELPSNRLAGQTFPPTSAQARHRIRLL